MTTEESIQMPGSLDHSDVTTAEAVIRQILDSFSNPSEQMAELYKEKAKFAESISRHVRKTVSLPIEIEPYSSEATAFYVDAINTVIKNDAVMNVLAQKIAELDDSIRQRVDDNLAAEQLAEEISLLTTTLNKLNEGQTIYENCGVTDTKLIDEIKDVTERLMHLREKQEK